MLGLGVGSDKLCQYGERVSGRSFDEFHVSAPAGVVTGDGGKELEGCPSGNGLRIPGRTVRPATCPLPRARAREKGDGQAPSMAMLATCPLPRPGPGKEVTDGIHP